MSRPGLTLLLWLALGLFVVLNDLVADHWLAPVLPVLTVEWYKTLVPLPYAAMLAIIHARRTAGPRWREAALLAALLWPTSTVVVGYLYLRMLYGAEIATFLDRFSIGWGAPYPLLVAFIAVAPLAAGALLSRR
ncbi:MAG: hypothetical protein U1E23_15880 [Reyranellaceae bacterium]